jgi:hypothetical protein
LGRDIPCARDRGDPLKPVREHETCFRREWNATLRAIAQQCPAARSGCAALLKVDPLDPRNDAAITAAVAHIRWTVSDPRVARSIVRERDRTSFGEKVIAMRRGKGWSVRRLARECAEAARQIGFGVRAPDHFQLMDYERGRSNAQPRTKVVLAVALGVAVDQIYG